MKKLSPKFLLFLLAAIIGGLHSFAQNEINYQEQQINTKTFLIVNSYSEASPWAKSVILPISYFIANNDDVHTELYHLNSVLITDTLKYKQVYDEFFNRFSNKKIDYIAFIGQVAFTFRDEAKRLWGDDLPMFLITRDLGIGNTDYYISGYNQVPDRTRLKSLSDLRNDYNLTTVYVPNYYKETIDLMCSMLPKMTELAFFVDGAYYNRHLATNVETYLAENYPTVKFKLIQANVDDNLTLQYFLMHKSDTTGLLMSSWFYEKTGPFGYPILVSGDMSLLGSSANPIFALRHAFMDLGAIGGVFYDPEKLYEDISSIVRGMVDGVQPRDMKFCWGGEDPVRMINYASLKEYDLLEKDCPPGTVFVNKPVSFWVKYSWQIITVLLILAIIFFLVARHNMSQKHEIELLSRHKKFIDYMPIPYSKARIQYTPDMKVATIKYTVYNQAFDDIVKENGQKDRSYILFPPEEISKRINELLTTNSQVKFEKTFPHTGKCIEFTLCLVQSRTKNSQEIVDYIDIFADDITERKKNERKLRDATQRLNQTIQIANIVPWEWDLENDIMYVKSDMFRRHDSINRSNADNNQWSAIPTAEFMRMIVKEDREELRHAREQMILGNIKQFHIEYRIAINRKGKEEIEWLDVSGEMSEPDKEGKPNKVVGTIMVVTDRKRQENELIEAEEKARTSDKMKSAFLANMSHEIRTPLNAIVGFSSLLAETDDQEKRKSFVNLININNNLLLNLVNDVLDLAKIESNTLDINKAPTDINHLMYTAGGSIRAKLQPDVELIMENGMEQCFVNIDSNRIIQVMMNLLNNAAKFTSSGSITFGYDLIGHGKLHFFVKDTGIGISPENKARLFKRFDRLNTNIQGTGLGLSICKHLIEHMGGNVGLESKGEGKGSTFWFDLPYEPVDEELVEEARAAYAESAPAPVAPVEPAPSKKTSDGDVRPLILIAEDIEGNYLLLKSFLGKNFRHEHAWDGQEAVDMFHKHKPDLILMDISMPKMDGYQATKEIRKTDKDIPIIAVTAYAYATDRKRILSSGFNDYLAKPISREEIYRAIERHLGQA